MHISTHINQHSVTPPLTSEALAAADAADNEETPEAARRSTDPQISDEARKELAKMQARDREVRAHEQAHLSAAGGLARGGPSFEFARGPDNRMYAVGGEVQIDTAPVAGDPDATIRKAAQIRRAALAPSNPSAQDQAVAVAALNMAAEARLEVADPREEDLEETESARETTAAEADETSTTCASCGGQHSTDAHAGITAYQATSGSEAYSQDA